MSLRSIFSILVAAPIAVAIIVFAVANRQPVQLTLDPFNTGYLGNGFELPMFVVLFGAVAVGVFVGGFASWIKQGKSRQQASEYRTEAFRVRQEADKLAAELESSKKSLIALPNDTQNAA